MKVGLVGFAGSGKSTVFRWLTGQVPDPSRVQQGQLAKADVPDDRLVPVIAKFKPKKSKYAEIDFLDTPGLMPDERADNPRRLGILREGDGLVVVLDGFGRADLAAQLRAFREEALFADHEIVANRVEKLEAQLKKPKPAKEREADQAEEAVLRRVIAAFDAGQPAATLGLREDEDKLVRSFQLLTLKPEQVLVSAGEAGIGQPLPADLLALAPTAVSAPAKLELELEELSPEDRAAFAADLGLAGSSRAAVIRALFASMGQIVFITVGEDECRTWPLAKGSTAVEGAASIHTDLGKRFVRAEVVGYDDFVRCGFSMKEAKAQGVFRLEGKTYVVQDADIMHILASS
jgi:ribosome-binding ATPase YchF (GTP1/OBG family)